MKSIFLYVVVFIMPFAVSSVDAETPWQAGFSLGVMRVDDHLVKKTENWIFNKVFGVTYFKGGELRLRRSIGDLPISVQGDFQYYFENPQEKLIGDTSTTRIHTDASLFSFLGGINWYPLQKRGGSFQPYIGGYGGWAMSKVRGTVSFLDTTNPNAHRLIIDDINISPSAFSWAGGGGFEHYFSEAWSFEMNARYQWTGSLEMDGVHITAGANYHF